MNSDLARRAHLNMVESFASLPPHQPGGFVRRADGVIVAATGSPIALFNEVLPVDDTVEAASLVAGVELLRAAGLRFFTWLREGTDEALLATVAALGLVEHASMPAMVLSDLTEVPEVPAGFTARAVTDQAGFDDHVRVATADPALIGTWLGPGVADDPAWTLLTGYADGVPVARSMSFRSGDVVGIYNVGTATAARRRGYGWAVTHAAIMAGAEAGCTVAILQSSAMARSMYEAHGFRTLFDYRTFGEPMPAEREPTRA